MVTNGPHRFLEPSSRGSIKDPFHLVRLKGIKGHLDFIYYVQHILVEFSEGFCGLSRKYETKKKTHVQTQKQKLVCITHHVYDLITVLCLEISSGLTAFAGCFCCALILVLFTEFATSW